MSHHLIISPASWRFAEEPATGPFVACELPESAMSGNTTLLSLTLPAPATCRVVAGDGSVPVERTLAGPLFDRLLPAAGLGDLLGADQDTASWAPLMIVSLRPGSAVVHAQIRTGDEEALFLHAGETVETGAVGLGAELQHAVRSGLALIENNRLFLNNHDCYYRKHRPEFELEYKLTLAEPVDLYRIAVATRNAVGGADMPGYSWQYRDDFQQWDFDNVLFEVAGPDSEAGYISFIPESTGGVTMKRKWFTTDAVARRESRWRGLRLVPENYPGHIERTFGVETVYRGSFRRRRFDVTCESDDTGNVHSIMYDRCTPYDREGPTLYQAEVEYLTSRSVGAGRPDRIDDELRFLLGVTRQLLGRAGIGFREGQLSKLSYLRGLDAGVAR